MGRFLITDCSGTKFLAQSKGGDPIKDETIQSSVQSLTHLMRNPQNTHFISLLLPFQEILNSDTAKQRVNGNKTIKWLHFSNDERGSMKMKTYIQYSAAVMAVLTIRMYVVISTTDPITPI